jgi:hypothetical protein
MWFQFANLIQAGQFRGASLIPEAISELLRRWWRWKGSKKSLQPKTASSKNASTLKEYRSYKEEHGNSPNKADTLIGGIQVAIQRGLWVAVTRVVVAQGGTLGQAGHLTDQLRKLSAIRESLTPKRKALNL